MNEEIKKEYLKLLNNDNKRKDLLEILKTSNLIELTDEFSRKTGYSLIKFIRLFSENKIQIKEKFDQDDKIFFKCNCGTEYEIYRKANIKDPISATTNVNPLYFSKDHEEFNCLKCNSIISIYGKMKKIEVNLNNE
jgi:nuclear transport factor 2 (NTF2) superfamily protein